MCLDRIRSRLIWYRVISFSISKNLKLACGYYKCEGAFRVDCIIMKMGSEATPTDT